MFLLASCHLTLPWKGPLFARSPLGSHPQVPSHVTVGRARPRLSLLSARGLFTSLKKGVSSNTHGLFVMLPTNFLQVINLKLNTMEVANPSGDQVTSESLEYRDWIIDKLGGKSDL